MTLEEIRYNFELSVRSYNLCIDNHLNSIHDLQNFLKEHKTFLKLRNCGKKSEIELTEICSQFENQIEEVEDFNKENFKTIVENFTRMQKEIVNNYISINTKNLSIRSQNAINSHLNYNVNLRSFVENILDIKYFNVKSIKNVGAKSIPELEVYIKNIYDFTVEVNNSSDEKHLIYLKNKFYIQKMYSLESIPNDVVESQSIFKIINYLINENAIFDKNQTIIFKKAFNIYKDHKEITLDKIAFELDLTRERVRQIRKICLDSIFEKLYFIKNISDDFIDKFSINSTIIVLKEDVFELINNKNEVNFSKEFILYLLSIYLSDLYLIVGNLEDILVPKSFNNRNRHNWKNIYLVKKDLTENFDFINLVDDLEHRLNERIEETYFLNFKSYLSKFSKNQIFENIDSILIISEKIISDEFDVYIDLDDNIVFPRNSMKTIPEYVFEVLEEIGKPSTIEKIYYELDKKIPNITKSPDALRGSCQRSDQLIYFGRSSTYGLKKWEHEMDNIKGGTIKDIIIDYLEKFQTPIHIVEILVEIHKYRELTNERNVITNLKLDPSNDFVIFNQKFIGLRSKMKIYDLEKYNNLPIQLGKTIIKLSKRNEYNSKEKLIKYLEKNYLLTENESANLITNLKLTYEYKRD